MKSFSESIKMFDHVPNGIWTFEPGYTVAKANGILGLRMDLSFINGEKEVAKDILVLDFKLSNGKSTNAFMMKGGVKHAVHESKIKGHISNFLNKMEGKPLISVKEIFDGMKGQTVH